MNAFLSILYVLGLYCPFAAGSMLLRNRLSFSPSKTRKFKFPQTTTLLLLAIAILSLLQFYFPILLTTFHRDYERFLHGEYWRFISPLFVQDGGISGTIFNLVSLTLLGSVVERFWNGRTMLIIFFTGGIIGEIVGFAWQPVGAGNSVGNFSLAASIAVISLTPSSAAPVQLLAIISLGTYGILFGLRDIHGAAAIAGALLTVFLGHIWHDNHQELG